MDLLIYIHIYILIYLPYVFVLMEAGFSIRDYRDGRAIGAYISILII